jgi:hypothetical protein
MIIAHLCSEEMWIKNIQDYTKFVLYGICSNCSQKYPVLVDNKITGQRVKNYVIFYFLISLSLASSSSCGLKD